MRSPTACEINIDQRHFYGCCDEAVEVFQINDLPQQRRNRRHQHHPATLRIFDVAWIGRDQRENYAVRRGSEPALAERCCDLIKIEVT